MALDHAVAFDRIPPQSLEMEQATLGAMLLDRTAIEKAAEILRAEDFYRPAHRTIFEAILSLVARDEAVDLLTVQEQLKLQGRLEDVGGSPYLYQLTDALATAANAEHYARVVEEKSILRRLIDASNQIQSLAHGEYDDINTVVDSAERSVFGVSQRRLGAYFKNIKELTQEVLTDIEYRSDHKTETTGVPTPFKDLNAMTAGLQPSDLVILAARPSMGKTTLALQMALHAALAGKQTVAIFSLEMANTQLCLRMICAEARVNGHRLRTGYLQDRDWGRVGQACAKIAEAPLYIDDSSDISALEIRAKCRRLKAEHELGLIIVDYLQLMRGHKRTDNRTQEIGEISRALKGLARELKVPVLALAQLSRAVEQRTDKVPMLSDLRESGSIEADADMVVFIYRKSTEPPKGGAEDMEAEEEQPGAGSIEEFQLIIAKQRNGPTGIVPVGFNRQFVRFENLDRSFRDS